MKRISTVILALILLFSIPCALAESASVDLSAMTLEELTALKDQLNLAIWNSSEWKEVTVPQGVWEIGVDIPAGHWTIKPTKENYATLSWGSELDEHKTSVSFSGFIAGAGITDANHPQYDGTTDVSYVDWELTEGTYIEIGMSSVIFTPYEGKPAFTFD